MENKTMRFTIFAFMLYISYIALGMSNPIVGSIWPVAYEEIGANVTDVGNISALNFTFFLISSLVILKFIRNFGTNVTISMALLMFGIAVALLSFTKNIIFYFVASALIGFGSGCIDISANNYMVSNYKAKFKKFEQKKDILLNEFLKYFKGRKGVISMNNE